MAKSERFIPGFKYEVKDGGLAGEVVIIKDNEVIRKEDDPINQRKIVVTLPDGSDYHILPRQLIPQPVGLQDVQVAPPVAQTVATALVAPTPLPTEDEMQARLDISEGPNHGKVGYQIKPITDPMDPRLDHLRPSRRKLKQYVPRDLDGLTDTEFFLTFTTEEYRKDPNNAMRPQSVNIKGDTQAGKTLLVQVLAIAWADRLGLPKPMPIFEISGSSGVTDYDLFGQTTSFTHPDTGAESLVWLPGMAELAAQVGGIFYIDEVNALDARVTTSLHSLIDHRHHFVNRNKAVWKDGQFMPEVTTSHPDLWVISTMNENYVGMGKQNEAFVNRFEHVVWDYDPAVEQTLVKSAAIRLLGDALRTARERNSVRTPVGTAALVRCVRNVKVFGAVRGLRLLTNMFNAQERPIVESIIEDRSIIILLNEELRQAAAEDRQRATP